MSFRASRETTCPFSACDGSAIQAAGDRRSRLRGLTGRDELPDVVRGMQDRLRGETSRQQAMSMLTAAYILAGLRLPPDEVDKLFQGVHEMEESSTYQAILERGMERGIERGRIEEAKAVVLIAGTERLGPPGEAVRSALNEIDDVNQLEGLLRRAVRIAAWDELLAPPDPSP